MTALAVAGPLLLRRVRPAPAAVAADQSLTTDDTHTEEKVR